MRVEPAFDGYEAMVTKVGRNRWIRWLTVGMLIGLGFTDIECRSADRISKTEAVSIAQAEARRIGYNFEPIAVEADDGNTGWQAFLRALEKDDPQVVKDARVATIVATAFVERNTDAAGVPLAPHGDFRIDDVLSPAPQGCSSPVIRNAVNRTWFAAGIPKLED